MSIPIELTIKISIPRLNKRYNATKIEKERNASAITGFNLIIPNNFCFTDIIDDFFKVKEKLYFLLRFKPLRTTKEM